MKKWLIKYKDQILIGVISSIIAVIIIGCVTSLLGLISDKKNNIVNFLVNILKFSFIIKVYYVLIIGIIWSLVSVTFRFFKYKKQKLKIIEAKYYTDENSIDITRELNESIEDDELKIVLSNNIAGDPHHGTQKKGLVKYKINGFEDTKEYEEGNMIDISQNTTKTTL